MSFGFSIKEKVYQKIEDLREERKLKLSEAVNMFLKFGYDSYKEGGESGTIDEVELYGMKVSISTNISNKNFERIREVMDEKDTENRSSVINFLLMLGLRRFEKLQNERKVAQEAGGQKERGEIEVEEIEIDGKKYIRTYPKKAAIIKESEKTQEANSQEEKKEVEVKEAGVSI